MWDNFKYLFLLLILFDITCCNTTEPPPDEQTIILKLEDISSTEAWITLTTTNFQLPATITLKQNNQNRTTINLTKADTLLYVDSLLPKQTYTFQSFTQPINQSEVKSNELSVTTMDTTSHDFAWQTWTFGTIGSSTLYDVTILNENNIWAVGEILIADTSINGYSTYGAVHWNGQIWELKKLFHNTNIPVTPRGILVLSPNEIYLAAGSIFLWDGTSSTVQMVFSRFDLPDPNGTIEKLWGSSSSSIYGVGNVGSIVFFNGSQWTRIESGTELHLYDIDGKYSEDENKYEVLVTAANRFVSFEKQILKINNAVSVIGMVTDGIPYSIKGIWFEAGKQYYVCGGGVFNKKNIEDATAWKELEVSEYYTEAIDGNGINDIVLCGNFGELLHFNGVGWKSYQELFSGTLLLNIRIKQDIIVSAGIDNPKAFITIGRR